ncbi:TPA_asm: HNH endonuclease [Mycobacterium phage prophiFSQJ01-1]|nr:TPA_asm: HNH endonuclease [Mycobacterium phage prophiFSQJ01-1]
MVWSGDGRGTGTDVPASVRRAVRIRDGDQCQLRYDGCTGDYEELDHIEGVAERGVDRRRTLTVDELQCACRWCHKQKTAKQAARGRSRNRWRESEPHPGRGR